MAELRVGASGFSFASWRPGFYPAGTKPGDFLAHYAGELETVEINNSFYKLPTVETFASWARTVPDGFRFAVKAPRAVTVYGRVDFAGDLNARVRSLGDRLGPLLVRLADKKERDEDFLARLLAAIDDDLDVALDLRHPSWDGIEAEITRRGAVRVNQLEGAPAPASGTCACATRPTTTRSSPRGPTRSAGCSPKASTSTATSSTRTSRPPPRTPRGCATW